MRVSNWVLAARPKTLLASASPLLLGIALLPSFQIFLFLGTLCFALLIQIGTNLANDYYDFIQGADTPKRKGPARMIQAGNISPHSMKQSFLLIFFLAALLGSYLAWMGGGWIMLLTTFLSLFLGIFYTAGNYSLAYLGIAEPFVLLFFGVVPCAGSFFLQTGTWHLASCLLGLGPGSLSTAILVMNNLRDYEEDQKAGKKTWVVKLGRAFGEKEYLFFLLMAPLFPLMLTYLGNLPSKYALFALFYLPSFWCLFHFFRKKDYQKSFEHTAFLLFLYTLLGFLL